MEREDVLVLLVGGGAVLVDQCVPLRGASRVISPKKYSVSVQLANHKAYTHIHMHMYTHTHTHAHTHHITHTPHTPHNTQINTVVVLY